MPGDDSPAPPSSWSKEVRDKFTPVKPLGVGGFGSVWLAMRKEEAEEGGHRFQERMPSHGSAPNGGGGKLGLGQVRRADEAQRERLAREVGVDQGGAHPGLRKAARAGARARGRAACVGASRCWRACVGGRESTVRARCALISAHVPSSWSAQRAPSA